MPAKKTARKTSKRTVQEKELIMSGGFELLSKLIPDSIGKEGLLKHYSKSLYVFACVNKIGEKVASIPLELYKVISSKGDMKLIDAHPLLDVLYRPNAFQTRMEFWKILIVNLKCAGQAFVYKVKDQRGHVVELINIRPDRITIVQDETRFIKGYKLRKSNGSEEWFEPEEIIYFKAPDPLDPYGGISPLFAGISRVQTEGYATDYQRNFFLNSARPDAVLKTPPTGKKLSASEIDELKKKWAKQHRGVGNSSKIAVLTGGMEYQAISVTNKEMDYIESLKMTRDDILIAFGVPKSVLGITEDVNRANAEAGMSVFLSETVKPTLTEIVEKINEEMTYPDFGDNIVLDFEDPTPENRELLLKEHTELVGANVLTVNEVREARGYPPINGGWKIYRSALDMEVGNLPGKKSMVMGGDTEEEAYLAPKKTRKFDFRGHYRLKQKLLFMEKAMRMAKKSFGKKALKPLIPKNVQATYAKMINNQIDRFSELLEGEIQSFFEAQHQRVTQRIAELKSVKKRSWKKELKVESIFDIENENRILFEFVSPKIRAILIEAGVEGLDTVAPSETFDQTAGRITEYVKRRSTELAESVNNTTLVGMEREIAEGIAENESGIQLASRIDEVFDQFPAYRNALIARTEATAANNQGLMESYRQSNVVAGKEWINAGDSRVRESHQNKPIGVGGEIVDVDKAFSNGLPYPMEPNCRCVIGPAVFEDEE